MVTRLAFLESPLRTHARVHPRHHRGIRNEEDVFIERLEGYHGYKERVK